MKEYMSKRKNSIDKRVRKVHRKAKSVGLLYLLGTVLLLATTMLFPVLKINGVAYGVTTFYQPLTKILSGGVWSEMIASAMYGLLLFVLIVNFFSCLGNLGWLTRRSYRYKNGYNRNMRAMSEMGKSFSSSLAAFVILHLQAYLLQAPSTVQFIAINAYITLGIGLFIHFVAGLMSGKVSRFYVGETGMVEEEKRTCSLFAYFFRNLIQVVATAAIIYGMAASNSLHLVFSVIMNLMKGSFQMDTLIVLGLQLFTLIFAMVLIKHATATTEFNLFGIEGRGMLNFRVFSFFTFLTGGALTAWAFAVSQSFNLNYAIIAGASLLAFLIDCIVKSYPKDHEDVVQPMQEPMQNGMYPAPMQGRQNVYLQFPAQQQMPMQQGGYQPIYVPVYYPYPQPQIQQVHTPMPVYYPQPMQPAAPMQPTVQTPAPVQAPVDKELMSFTRPEPAPAPDYLKPTPSPEAAKEEGIAVKSKKELHEERKELTARKAELKREKEQSKRAEKMAKKNRKADAKTAKMAAEIAARREALNTAALAATAAAVATNAAQQAPELPVETSAQAPVVETPNVEKHFDGEVNELPATLNPKKNWRVRCPQCGKELNVKDTTPYHRCPACSKVFTLRKFETYTKKEETLEN